MEKAKKLEALNNQDQIAETILQDMLKSYYLDDGQLDYLHANYHHIFDFADSEVCICFSGKNYDQCCKTRVVTSTALKTNYISLIEVIKNNSLKDKYIKQEIEQLKSLKYRFNQQEGCMFISCDNKAINISLYELNDFASIINNKKSKNEQVYLIDKVNENHIIKNPNQSFLSLTAIDQTYQAKLVCQKHYDSFLKVYESNISYIAKTLLFNLYQTKIEYQNEHQAFVKYYNNRSKLVEQVLMVLKLRKKMSLLAALESEWVYINSILTDQRLANNYKSVEYVLPYNENFVINDILLPQVTPNSYRCINSLNNPFVENKLLFVHTVSTNKQSMKIIFNYHYQSEVFALFFSEWNKIIKSTSQKQNFISSMLVSLANHLMLSTKFYDSLTDNSKRMLNAYYYYRFEQPSPSQSEYVIMNFFTNLHKGLNLWKKRKIIK